MSREGNGRHRQAWIVMPCPHCGQEADARRTLPGKPLHFRVHFDRAGFLCPPFTPGSEPVTVTEGAPPEFAGQGRLFCA